MFCGFMHLMQELR